MAKNKREHESTAGLVRGWKASLQHFMDRVEEADMTGPETVKLPMSVFNDVGATISSMQDFLDNAPN